MNYKGQMYKYLKNVNVGWHVSIHCKPQDS